MASSTSHWPEGLIAPVSYRDLDDLLRGTPRGVLSWTADRPARIEGSMKHPAPFSSRARDLGPSDGYGSESECVADPIRPRPVPFSGSSRRAHIQANCLKWAVLAPRGSACRSAIPKALANVSVLGFQSDLEGLRVAHTEQELSKIGTG